MTVIMTVSEQLKNICTMNIIFVTIILLSFYSPTHSEWISQSDNTIPTDDTMFAVGSYNGSIYLLGGFNKKRQQTIYDIKTNSFVFYRSEFVPEGNKVFGEAQFWTQIGSNLYILDDIIPLSNKITVFNMETNSFISEFDNMPIPMSDGMGRACITSIDNLIFINGGITNRDAPEPMTDTYILNIDNMPSWGLATQMLTGRRSHSCIIHPNNKILYSIGGASSDGLISSIEQIQIENIHDNKWTFLNGNLTNPSKGLRSFIYGQQIVIIGGVNGRTFFDTIHIIDINTNLLQVSQMKLAFPIAYSAAIMVDNIQYSFGGGFGNDIWQSFISGSKFKSPTTNPIANTQIPTAPTAQSGPDTTDLPPTITANDRVALWIIIAAGYCLFCLFCGGITMVYKKNKSQNKAHKKSQRRKPSKGEYTALEVEINQHDDCDGDGDGMGQMINLCSCKYQTIFYLSILLFLLSWSALIILSWYKIWLAVVAIIVAMILQYCIIKYISNINDTFQRHISNDTDPFKYLEDICSLKNIVGIKNWSNLDSKEYHVTAKFQCVTELKTSFINKSKYYQDSNNIEMIQFNVSFTQQHIDSDTKQELLDYIKLVKETPNNNRYLNQGRIFFSNLFLNASSSLHPYKYSTFDIDESLTVKCKKIVLLKPSDCFCCIRGCLCVNILVRLVFTSVLLYVFYLYVPLEYFIVCCSFVPMGSCYICGLVDVKRGWLAFPTLDSAICGWLAFPTNTAMLLYLFKLNGGLQYKNCLTYNIKMYHRIQSREKFVINGFLRELERQTVEYYQLHGLERQTIEQGILEKCKCFVGEFCFSQSQEFVFQTLRLKVK